MKKLLAAAISLSLVLVAGASMGATKNTVARADTNPYEGAFFLRQETVTINYAYKQETENFISYAVPKYYETTENMTGCANIAGATVLGFYDKAYDELIPNYTAGRDLRGRYVFYGMSDTIENVILDLRGRMQTDVGQEGTTIPNFKAGLSSYVASKGRSASYTNVINNGYLNHTAFDQKIAAENCGVLYLWDYAMVPIDNFAVSDTQDQFTKKVFSGRHMVTVYGRKNIKYYNENDELIRELNFVRVATGFSTESLIYIMLNDGSGTVVGGDMITVS